MTSSARTARAWRSSTSRQKPLSAAQAWSARLEGFVARPGEAKQRVVITMKGRPEGVFVLTPLQPGVLKRDSGTLTYTHATG